MFDRVYRLVRIRSKTDVFKWAASTTIFIICFACMLVNFLHYGPVSLPVLTSVLITTIIITAPTTYWASFQLYLIYRLGIKFKSQAEIDTLTGVKTRRYLFDTLFHKLVRGTSDYVLLMVDVDHFKSINDTYNHLIGDEVLKHMAKRMKNACRENDVVCRFGGEEFIVVLPDSDYDAGWAVAERIRSKIASEDFKSTDVQIPVTVSIGLSKGDPSANLEHVLQEADDALYEAKEGGRNQTVVSGFLTSGIRKGKTDNTKSEFLPDAIKKTMTTFEDMFTQSSNDTYCAHYHGHVLHSAFQPIYKSGPDNSLILKGFEASVRTGNDNKKIVPAELFKHVSVKTRAQLEFLSIALHIRNFSTLNSPGKKLFLNINQDLLGCLEQVCELLDFVKHCTIFWNIPREMLVLEILEAEAKYPTFLSDFSDGAKSRQLFFAMNDFGNGGSDPITNTIAGLAILKLDPILFRRSCENNALSQLLEQLCKRVRQRGINIIVDGIENEEQLRNAVYLGAGAFQGPYLNNPQILPFNFSDTIEGKMNSNSNVISIKKRA